MRCLSLGTGNCWGHHRCPPPHPQSRARDEGGPATGPQCPSPPAFPWRMNRHAKAGGGEGTILIPTAVPGRPSHHVRDRKASDAPAGSRCPSDAWRSEFPTATETPAIVIWQVENGLTMVVRPSLTASWLWSHHDRNEALNDIPP